MTSVAQVKARSVITRGKLFSRFGPAAADLRSAEGRRLQDLIETIERECIAIGMIMTTAVKSNIRRSATEMLCLERLEAEIVQGNGNTSDIADIYTRVANGLNRRLRRLGLDTAKRNEGDDYDPLVELEQRGLIDE